MPLPLPWRVTLFHHAWSRGSTVRCGFSGFVGSDCSGQTRLFGQYGVYFYLPLVAGAELLSSSRCWSMPGHAGLGGSAGCPGRPAVTPRTLARHVQRVDAQQFRRAPHLRADRDRVLVDHHRHLRSPGDLVEDRGHPCACRKCHPCRSGGMMVFVEDAAQSWVSTDVEAGDLGMIGDRFWQWSKRSGVGDALVGPVVVVELLVFAECVE
jgi:hypothetical protein